MKPSTNKSRISGFVSVDHYGSATSWRGLARSPDVDFFQSAGEWINQPT
jgi:hypothetical protein